MRSAAGAVVLVSAALATLTACGSHPTGDPAVWYVDTDGLTPHSRAFDVMVVRVGCSGGMQGTPETPVVDAGRTSIVITIRISPHFSGAGTCIGTPGVPYRVQLDEPIGHRSLVDGECHSGSPASGTSDCQPSGVRWTWGDRSS